MAPVFAKTKFSKPEYEQAARALVEPEIWREVALVTVPSVVNLTQAAAVAALTSASLTLGTVSNAPSASVLAFPHPSGASTWLNEPAREALWGHGVELLAAQWGAVQERR